MALIIEIAAMLASVPLFIFGLALGDCLMLLWGVLALYAGTALYCIRNRRSMKYAVIFLASWGLFMLGRVVVRLPEGVYLLAKFTEEEVVHTFQSLYLALAFFLLGLAAFQNIRFKRREGTASKTSLADRVDTSALGLLSGITFAVTLPFRVGVIYYYVQTALLTGYRSLYLNGNANIPGFIDALSRIHVSALIIYLILFPKKKRAYLVSAIELAVSGLYLAAGKRIEFIQIVVLIFVILLMRDAFQADPRPFFTGKRIAVICVTGVVLIVLLQFIGYSRFSETMENTGLWGIVTDFLDTIGYSVEIIPLGKRHTADFFGNNTLYFWGPFFNWLKSITGIGTLYSGQTLETVQYGYSFGDALTYFESAYLYLVQGGGLGSSYIAELYHSYGYLGIAAFNLLLGNMVSRLEPGEGDSWFSRYIKTYIFIGVILLPRFNCWVWMTDVISKANILFWVALVIGMKLLSSRNRQGRLPESTDDAMGKETSCHEGHTGH